jgi:hypothetical protein
VVNAITSKLVVVDDKTQTILLDLCHDHSLAGHFSQDKTFERLSNFIWWPQMRLKIANYCQSCQPCQEGKRRTGKPFGLLQKIDTPHCPWEVIHMDFVTALPPEGKEKFDAVMCITDRLSKMVKFVPCHKSDTAEDVAYLYNTNVLTISGLPRIIITDRDPRFTSGFWKTLHILLGTRLAMSTAHHAQTDGLAERQIGTLEECLRTFCSFGSATYRENILISWVTLLPQLEFAYNSSVHAVTKSKPFETAYGWCPKSIEDVVKDSLNLNSTVALNNDAQTYHGVLRQAQQRAHDAITHAFNLTKKRYDNKHQEMNFENIAKAYISTKYFSFDNVAEKMKAPFIGPYEIEKCIGPNAVKLKLPKELSKRHPVFPVGLLKPAKEALYPFEGRQQYQRAKPVLVNEDGSTEWEVELILSQRTTKVNGKQVKQYLVKWKDWDEESWVNEADLHAPKLLQQFLKQSQLPRRTRQSQQRHS